ncbi:ethanolamine propanediol utilization protein [Latilactobacillus curvatus]|nr:ethanolamine propanediol utilization protein [Latilactobacillus curvatus]
MVQIMAHATGLERIIQEYVPGKQLSLAHIVASPTRDLYEKLGLNDCHDAIGIITVTPSESAIIAGDQALKSGAVDVGFVDRFSGSVFITGKVSDVHSSLESVIYFFENQLHFSATNITKS